MIGKILPFRKRSVSTSANQPPAQPLSPTPSLYDKQRVEKLYQEINLLDQYLKYVEENHIRDIDIKQYEEWVRQNHPELR